MKSTELQIGETRVFTNLFILQLGRLRLNNLPREARSKAEIGNQIFLILCLMVIFYTLL